MGKFEEFYEKNYKKLIIISYAILLISLILIGIHFARTGEFFNRDISLKGGISVTLYNEKVNFNELDDLLKQNFKDYSLRELKDFSTNKNIGFIVEVADITAPQLREVLQDKIDINFDDKNEYDPGLTSSSFGESFYRGLLIALLFSFILMAIFIFFSFKTFTPSLAVISATLIDVLATLVLLNIFGVKISAAGIVAFLLIIGYSIDNNILLTTALLKRREGSLYERLKGSMKTGMTTTIAAITVSAVGYFLSAPEELKQIFLIITIASLLDIITTYVGNAGILIRYCKKKNIT